MIRLLAVVAAVLVCLENHSGSAGDLALGQLSSMYHPDLSAKWRAAQRQISEDAARLSACRSETWMCSEDELRLQAIVDAGRARQGRARIGEINRSVNLAIRPTSDLRRFGVMDHWSGPLETIAAAAGDCEDYAILKLLALQEAGFALDDLQLMIVHDRVTRTDHAVAAVRLSGEWLLLDNRGFALVDLSQTSYRVLAQLPAETGGSGYAALAPVRLSRDLM